MMEVKSVLTNSDNSTELVLYPPSEADMLVQEEAGFVFLDMLSYGSGIFSLWLGFSISGLGTQLADMVGRTVSGPERAQRMADTMSAPCLPRPSVSRTVRDRSRWAECCST
ncbi:hypothetical protein HDE_03924 [Halotydeus destructor]|nr:hypothetical protein HDE_03924 [Halotydeus destructor]